MVARAERSPLEGSRSVGAIVVLSAAAVAFLFWLIYFKEGITRSADRESILPALNAGLNSASALAIVVGYVAIRRRNIKVHATAMVGALLFSAAFLLCYVAYYWLHGNTQFQSQGAVRVAYFSILISHIVVSIVALPMVLTTFYFAVTRQFHRHPRLGRWTYPLWLYVSVTGVVVFFLVKYVG